MHSAAAGLRRLRRAVAAGADAHAPADLSAEPLAAYRARFTDAIADDLGLPAALAVAHSVASADDLDPSQKRALLLDFDRVLGLSLDAPVDAEPMELPDGAAELLEQRAAARARKDWAESDRLRQELAQMGVDVADTQDGQRTSIR
jgi:cysteinyl-tRNA synthetase